MRLRRPSTGITVTRWCAAGCAWFRMCVAASARSLGPGMSPRRSAGISSYVSPRRRRPVSLLRTPPHCLKKNGTPTRAHWSRILRTHSSFHGTRSVPALASDNDPADAVEIDGAEVFQERLDREEANPERRLPKVLNARQAVLAVFDADAPTRRAARAPRARAPNVTARGVAPNAS